LPIINSATVGSLAHGPPASAAENQDTRRLARRDQGDTRPSKSWFSNMISVSGRAANASIFAAGPVTTALGFDRREDERSTESGPDLKSPKFRRPEFTEPRSVGESTGEPASWSGRSMTRRRPDQCGGQFAHARKTLQFYRAAISLYMVGGLRGANPGRRHSACQ